MGRLNHIQDCTLIDQDEKGTVIWILHKEEQHPKLSWH